MGQQQLLLIILGVIIVGIAIAVGLQLFQSGSIGANQDAMINDIMNIAAHADQFRIRPVSMGGGGGDFDGGNEYQLPTRMEETGNGRYEVDVDGSDQITITGTSVQFGTDDTIVLVYQPLEDDEANRYNWTFNGVFSQ